ncbi:methyltransferase [Fusarium albosuccineum]|uniref:Methyltransferase n=1 Tax=Fusarium albosuccineum TaxID=1237068 RepID=A0A8H4KZT9_9HYPO|nr:methyltransferase [Fusarium albosuccineum]
MASPTEQPHEPLTADDFDDGDSAISDPDSAGVTSLRSSVLRFQEENGRTYHAMSSGKYSFPNDEDENNRLDLQHNLWLLTLQGELGLCPKIQKSARRVLDAGTGTGIWAIEVPPNCIFELDDLEKDWTWSAPFDLIFARVMTGCFTDMQEFVHKAYKSLEPGGYLEMQDLTHPFGCDDGTLREDLELARFGRLCIEASANAHRPIDVAPKYKDFLEKAGFVNIVEKRFKWPLNGWPKDKHYKELGKWSFVNLNGGLEGLALGLFTRFLDWSADEVRLFCTAMRKQLRDQSIHAYIPM